MDTNIITKEHGSYLEIETESVRQVIEATLARQDVDFSKRVGKKITEYGLHGVTLYDNDSTMEGRIMFKNGHDCALTLFIGAFRFVCMNGLMIGQGIGGRVIHRVGPKAYDFVENVETITQKTLEYMVNGSLQSDIDFYREETVEKPIEIVASLPIQKTTKETVLYHILNGTATENVNNVWGLYNFVNETVRRRASKSFDSSLNKDIGLLEHIDALNNYSKVA